MRAKDIDKTQPIWVLQGARAWGPFGVTVVGIDIAVLRVPNDRRLWAGGRGGDHRITGFETFPVSALTQDPEAARAWDERNEPRVGDLVSVIHGVWERNAKGSYSRVNATHEGVVISATEHQVTVHAPERHKAGLRVAKDACVVISRGG